VRQTNGGPLMTVAHGSVTGKGLHRRRGEKLCSDCARWWADYMAVRRVSGRATGRDFGEATQMIVIERNARTVTTEAELREALTRPEVFWCPPK
jgi:hypothetical protein